MHVQSAPDRKQLVEEVLYRHCDCEVEGEGELSDKEVFIIEELLVPQECVYTAKVCVVVGVHVHVCVRT